MTNRFSAASAILPLLTMSLTAAPVGSIRGTVYHEHLGVAPGATVTVTDEETNVTRQVKSDERGQYAVSNLPPGIYTVAGAVEGLAPAKQTGILVRDTSTVVVPLLLPFGRMICVG